MAPPRFAPTGRRQQPPSQGPPGGFSLPPPQAPRGGISRPPVQVQLGQPTGLPDARFSPTGPLRFADPAARESRRFAGIYKRPLSTLGAVFRVLGVGENVAVGFGESVQQSARNFDRLIQGKMSPWAFISSIGEGNSFSEIHEAVKENKTYEDWLRRSSEPGDFLYENAFVVGLGLSIFGDPTTYVTFGTTSVSKTAGQKLLAASYMSTADETAEAITTGVIRRTGENALDYDNDFDKIFHRIHSDAARPYTVGDSLQRLRAADRGELPDISEQWKHIMGVTSRGPVRRTFRRAFARGGQGVRFGGVEIPGSRAIAPAFGRAVGRVPGVPDREEALELFKAVIPDYKLRQVTEDATRAVAMAEFTRVNNAMAIARTGAFEDALETFALDPVRASRAANAPYIARAAIAVRNIFDDTPLAVPKGDRLDLFKSGHRPTGRFANPLKAMRESAYKKRDRLLQEAEDMGFTEAQIDNLRADWEKLTQELRDPVDVLARFEAGVVGKMAAHNAIDSLMYNPLIARPLLEGGDELLRIEDDMAELNERIARATARYNEKGITDRAKKARYAVLQELNRKSETLVENHRVITGRIKEQKGVPDSSSLTTVYHGTPEARIEELQVGGGQHSSWGPGIYFTTNKDRAMGYTRKGGATAGHVQAAQVDTRGLLDMVATKEIDAVRRRVEAVLEPDQLAALRGVEDATLGRFSWDKADNGEGIHSALTIMFNGMQNRKLIAADVDTKGLANKVLLDAGFKGLRFSDEILMFSQEGIVQAGKRGQIGGVLDEAAARAAFHENAVPYRWRGKKYYVPAPIAQALDEMRNPQLIDKEIRKWFRAINFTQNKWKILATSLNPRFHVMNLVGGTWNNMLGGVYNPGDYAQQWISLFRQRIGRMDTETGLAKALGPVQRGLDQDKLARDRMLIDAYDERGTGGGFISHETHPEFQEMKRRERAQTKKGQAFTTARRTYAVGTLGLTVAPDEWVPDEIEDSPLFSPLAGVVAGLPELSRAGRYLANDVETVLRETPMRVAMQDPSYYQLMDAYSLAPPVNFGRWMGETDIGRVQMGKELVWDIGAANALRYQFDYSNLTNFERYFAKTIFPFYTFNKNNFILQAKELAQRPRFLAVTGDVMNFSNQVTATEENEAFQAILPEYFDKLAMFRVPVPAAMREVMGLPQDQDLYLNPTIPFASLNLFPPLWEIANDDSLTPTNHRWLQMFAPMFGLVGPNAVLPMFKPMVEYSIGYNLGLARPIDYQALQSGGWRHSYREAPNFMKYVPKQLQSTFGVYKDPSTGHLMMDSSMAYITEQMASPFINASGDIFNWGQGGVEADRTRANNFAFITGVRLTPVDPLRLQRSWLYRAENFLEGRKADAKRRGVEFSRDDNYLLARIRQQLKVVEVEWDRKQESLFGEKD